MASSDGVSKRKSTSNVYTPILPQEWRLNFGSGEQESSHEIGGPIGRVIKSTGTAFKKVDKGVRRKADQNLVASLRFLLKKIGAIVLTALHDSAMPKKVHSAIDEIFVITWPEVEKGILDGLVLDLGFQFKDYREKASHHEAQYPTAFFERCRATLLYAMKPFDLSFFGMMRDPTLFAINLIFLFPLLGVDSICVMTLWLCTYKYDEFQLAAFIITSKGLGLITVGLISGVIGFVKLYMCSMVDDPNDPGSCQHKAPHPVHKRRASSAPPLRAPPPPASAGARHALSVPHRPEPVRQKAASRRGSTPPLHSHPNVRAQAPGKYLTAEWEFWLYMFRVVLLWVTFFQLNFLPERHLRHRKQLAARLLTLTRTLTRTLALTLTLTRTRTLALALTLTLTLTRSPSSSRRTRRSRRATCRRVTASCLR